MLFGLFSSEGLYVFIGKAYESTYALKFNGKIVCEKRFAVVEITGLITAAFGVVLVLPC